MSKKRRQQRNNPPESTKAAPPAKESSTEAAAKAIEQAKAEVCATLESTPKELLEKLEKEDITAGSAPGNGDDTENADLAKLIKHLNQQTDAVKRARSLVAKREEEAAATKKTYETRLKEIEDRSNELQRCKSDCDKLDKELKERQDAILAREVDADAGFISRHKDLISKLEQEVAGYATELAKHSKTLAKERDKILGELTAERARLDSERETTETELREKSRKLDAELRKVGWDFEDLKAEKESWQQRLNERVNAGVAAKLGEIKTLTDRVGQLQEELDQARETQRILGHNDPEKLRMEMKELRDQNQKLKDQIADSVSAINADDYDTLTQDNKRLKDDLEILMQRNQELNRREGKAAIGVAELENLRDQRETWMVREGALRANIATLKEELHQYVEQSKSREVFPECTRMDQNEELQATPSLDVKGQIDLKRLVDRARMLIADNGFFYQEVDLRAFVAGLATTRLHILQGISGTGKTSLPREFAKVLGWTYRIIEVQSGWRDRQDLLGYYNSFEHHFYESPFMQALYEAGCPALSGLPVFIVLDEMNLSHPEHYFADFLSTLENENPGNQSVPLLTSRLKGSPAPRNLLDDGKAMRVPKNCWFIGTANHDETTKGFAPKTYDRANVMEFPRNPKRFKTGEVTRFASPISYEVLQEAFTTAMEQHASAATLGLRILRKDMEASLHSLDIGWGNRFENQLASYLPVFVACGGTVGEGLDYLVANKLLRKLNDRFDLQVDRLNQLSAVLEAVWSSDSGLNGSTPARCMEILAKESERLCNNQA